ncbi:MAG: caspase family protein [Candidatus Thorarchaeota archaeon]|nr:caspase family protein [Candidatus Thorarchaeota archaeon]
MTTRLRMLFASIMVLSVLFFSGASIVLSQVESYTPHETGNQYTTSQLGPIEDPDPPPPPPSPPPINLPPAHDRLIEYPGNQLGILGGIYFPKARYSNIVFEVNYKGACKIHFDIENVYDNYSRYINVLLDGVRIFHDTIPRLKDFHGNVYIRDVSYSRHTLTFQINYGGYKQFGWLLSNVSVVEGKMDFLSVYLPQARTSTLSFAIRAGLSTELNIFLESAFSTNIVDNFQVLIDLNRVFGSGAQTFNDFWTSVKTIGLGNYVWGSEHLMTIRVYDYSTSPPLLKIPLSPSSQKGMYVRYGNGVTKKWAVIVGIEQYKSIPIALYASNDANEWYHYLHDYLEYDVLVFWDNQRGNNFPQHDHIATEHNVKNALREIAKADSDDYIALILAGHGASVSSYSMYTCMWDDEDGEQQEDGRLYDTELASIAVTWSAKNIFIFSSTCSSGGIITKIMDLCNADHFFVATTCGINGQGFSHKTHHYSGWTYYFLVDGLENHFQNSNPSMESCFNYSSQNYGMSTSYVKDNICNQPEQFDGNPDCDFRL